MGESKDEEMSEVNGLTKKQVETFESLPYDIQERLVANMLKQSQDLKDKKAKASLNMKRKAKIRSKDKRTRKQKQKARR